MKLSSKGRYAVMALADLAKFNLNEPVSFNHNNSEKKGIFKGINENGHAIIEIKNKLSTFPSLTLK